MTIENDPIAPLLQKARAEGYNELIVIADCYPYLMKPKQDGGLVHTTLTDHELIPNSAIAAYLLSVGLDDGVTDTYLNAFLQDERVRLHVETNSAGRLSLSFRILSSITMLTQSEIDELVTINLSGVSDMNTARIQELLGKPKCGADVEVTGPLTLTGGVTGDRGMSIEQFDRIIDQSVANNNTEA